MKSARSKVSAHAPRSKTHINSPHKEKVFLYPFATGKVVREITVSPSTASPSYFQKGKRELERFYHSSYNRIRELLDRLFKNVCILCPKYNPEMC